MSLLAHSGAEFINLLPGSITTSVTSSHQFICVTVLSVSPQWYYKYTLLPSSNMSKADSFIDLYETGNYTCSINNRSNYTITLTAGLYSYIAIAIYQLL